MAKSNNKTKGGQSLHSRASRRASSPSINTDKSLKNVELPKSSSKHRPSVLAIHVGAGVTKKSRNGRKSVLSARAKRRQEKGLDRAEAVLDKKEKKIEKSRGKARTIQERSKAWDDLNTKIALGKAQGEGVAGTTAGKDVWVDDEGMTDVEEAEDTLLDDIESASIGVNAITVSDEQALGFGDLPISMDKAPESAGDEEEIL